MSDAGKVSCVPLTEWAAADRTRFEAALRTDDVLKGNGPGAHLRPNTVRRHRKGYGRFLAWLIDERLIEQPDLASAMPFVTEDLVYRYVSALRRVNAPGTVLDRACSLFVVSSWLEPGASRGWFKALLQRLAARAEGVIDKRTRLRRSNELAALGIDMMREAECGSDTRLTRERQRDLARLYRDGFMIALLAARPLRLGNLIAMRIGRHLRRDGERWLIGFEAHETKNRKPVEMLFPDDLMGHLDRYLNHWRPRLAPSIAASAADALWLTEQGRAISPSWANTRINRFTERAFGLPVNPHLFRDAAATTVAIHRPDEVGIINQLLHNSIGVTERYYNLARTTEAARHLHDVFEGYCKPD